MSLLLWLLYAVGSFKIKVAPVNLKSPWENKIRGNQKKTWGSNIKLVALNCNSYQRMMRMTSRLMSMYNARFILWPTPFCSRFRKVAWYRCTRPVLFCGHRRPAPILENMVAWYRCTTPVLFCGHRLLHSPFFFRIFLAWEENDGGNVE